MRAPDAASIAKIVGVLLVLAWVGIPIYSMMVVSLTPQGAAASGLSLPTSLSLEHYREVLTGVQALWPYLWNSIVIAGLATLVALVLSLPCAYALSRLQAYRTARGVYLAVFVLRMLPPITLAIPFFIVMSRTGLLDTKTGLVIALLAQTLPLAVWTSKVFFDAIPVSLDEAARIDGAGQFQVFWQIMLPIAAGGIAVTAVLTFLIAYIDYIFVVSLANRQAMTLPLYVAGFKTEYRFYVGDMLAATAVGTLPMIAVFVLVQRHMKRMVLAGVH
jgi:multiple sugar transport system permease protein